MGIGTYKEFITLLKREIVELDDYPLKSIYRNLKRVMDINFDQIYIIDATTSNKKKIGWQIIGKYNKLHGDQAHKRYVIYKDTGSNVDIYYFR